MTARVLIGNRVAQEGVWVSKPGFDANSTNDEDFLLTPNRPLVQPYLQGRIYSDGSSVVSTKVTHGLGYVPVCLVFGQVEAQPTSPPSLIQVYGSIVDTQYLHINGYDDTNRRSIYNVNFVASIDVVYVIFRTQLTAS